MMRLRRPSSRARHDFRWEMDNLTTRVRPKVRYDVVAFNFFMGQWKREKTKLEE